MTTATRIWFMRGVSRIATSSPGAVGSEWQVKAIGDFNGDFLADILWHSTADGHTAVWHMTASGLLGFAGYPRQVVGWEVEGLLARP